MDTTSRGHVLTLNSSAASAARCSCRSKYLPTDGLTSSVLTRFSFNSGNSATLSNNEFDGRTTNTRTCNNDHYWTIMIVGKMDKITFDRNYLHDVSGRAPKIGSTDGVQIVQATNNWYAGNTGHAFDISFVGAKVLLEGNRFENQPQAMTPASSAGKVFNVHDSGDRTACASLLGRNCEQNALTSSGGWSRRADNSVLQEMAKYRGNLVTPLRYGDVKGHVNGNYGIGRI